MNCEVIVFYVQILLLLFGAILIFVGLVLVATHHIYCARILYKNKHASMRDITDGVNDQYLPVYKLGRRALWCVISGVTMITCMKLINYIGG